MTSSQEHAEAVCRQLTLETHTLYVNEVAPRLERLAKESSRPELGPAGYDMMFGPPLLGAEIFFIGYHPGGTIEQGKVIQPADRTPVWPSQCEYAVSDWKLARVLQAIFSTTFLLQCTGSERQFFRAADSKTYGMWPNDLRRLTEDFSLRHLRTLVEVLAPKRVVFIGKKAMETTVDRFDVVEQRERGDFLIGTTEFAGVPAMGCVHLSGGARLTRGEVTSVTKALRDFGNVPDDLRKGLVEVPQTSLTDS